jgi:MFS family permease
MSEPAATERAVLVTVALGSMLVSLNSTMIAVALPRVEDAFDTSLGAVSWLVTSYLIVMAWLQPVAGSLGDRVGRWCSVGSPGCHRIGGRRRGAQP